MLMTDQLTYTLKIDDKLNAGFYLMNSYRKKSGISADEIRLVKYDKDILKMGNDNRLTAIREGMTTVGVEYKGLRREICVRVLPDDCDDSKIRSFYPMCKRLDISTHEPIILKIRPMAVFANYDIHELSGYEINSNSITFRSSDTSVCTIEKDGTLKIHQPGTAVITVAGEDCRYTIDVYVTE